MKWSSGEQLLLLGQSGVKILTQRVSGEQLLLLGQPGVKI